MKEEIKIIPLKKATKFLKNKNYKTGYFCDGLDKAPIKVGSVIRKVNSEPGDATPNGTLGKVIGSLSELIKPDNMEADHVYAVTWSNREDVIVGVMGKKLEIVTEIN